MNLFRRTTPWNLADAAERHAQSPDTFRVPADAATAALRVGDRAKLIVVPRDGLEERVWVRVTAVGDEELEGALSSDPVELRGLHAGETVRFERRHVVAISPAAPSS